MEPWPPGHCQRSLKALAGGLLAEVWSGLRNICACRWVFMWGASQWFGGASTKPWLGQASLQGSPNLVGPGSVLFGCLGQAIQGVAQDRLGLAQHSSRPAPNRHRMAQSKPWPCKAWLWGSPSPPCLRKPWLGACWPRCARAHENVDMLVGSCLGVLHSGSVAQRPSLGLARLRCRARRDWSGLFRLCLGPGPSSAEGGPRHAWPGRAQLHGHFV